MAHEACEKHELTGCTFCSGKYTCLEDLRPKKAKKAPRAVKAARKDHAMSICDLVAEGKMCGICRTLYKPIGCQCSRKAHFERMVPAGISWLKEHHLELDTGKSGSEPLLIAAGLAFTSYARAARRAGIPANPDTAVVTQLGPLSTTHRVEAGRSPQEVARSAIIAEFDVEPKWSPPRVTEANFLPV